MGWAFKSKHNTIIFTEELMSFFESKRNQREGEKSTKTADAEVKKKKNYMQPLKKAFQTEISDNFLLQIYIFFWFIHPNFFVLV